MTTLGPTPRTAIGRAPERGAYDRATVDAILDAGLLCHVGIATDHGPVVIPTTYARVDDALVIHGSPAATWLRSMAEPVPVCVTVTLLDGLVLARSAFHHSMNYRSVVVFGQARKVVDHDRKAALLDALVEHLVPGRTAEVRPTTDEEIRKTLVVELPLTEASAKVRTGGPKDEAEDYALTDVWAGVLPLPVTPSAPIPDPRLADPSLAVPPAVRGWTRT